MTEAARLAYSAWTARMSPEEKLRAKALGVATHTDDDAEVGGHSPYATTDLADSPLASIEPDFAEIIDTEADTMAEDFGISLVQANQILAWHKSISKDSLRRNLGHYLGVIVGGLLSSKNPKLSAAGLAFAAGLDSLNGLGCQREYARKNHLSPSAISKVVIAWQRSLELNPSAHQKSEDACNTYSEVGKARHWRAQRVTSSTASKLLSRINTTNPIAN